MSFISLKKRLIKRYATFRKFFSEERNEGRGGFVLKARSEAPSRRRRSLSERSLAVKRTILSGLRIKKQHSTGDIHQRVTSITGSFTWPPPPPRNSKKYAEYIIYSLSHLLSLPKPILHFLTKFLWLLLELYDVIFLRKTSLIEFYCSLWPANTQFLPMLMRLKSFPVTFEIVLFSLPIMK